MIKTLADFKRSMQVGSVWDTKHCFLDTGVETDKGPRTCTLANTVNFGFLLPNGRISYCEWPKARECTFDAEGESVTIIKGGVRLTYTFIS